MFRRAARLLLALAAFVLPSALLLADEAVPALTRHVTDLTGTLSAQQVDQLDAQLVSLEKTKGAQLVVLMVPTTEPQDIAEYSLAVAEKNKIGRKGTDDGLLLLVAKNDRRVRIEVGYGLEGAVPDAATARIIREYIAPKFRTNDYYGGIHDALGALTQLVNGEALPPLVESGNRERRHGIPFGQVLLIGVFAGFFLRGMFGRTTVWLRTPLGALATGGLVGLLAASAGAAIFGAIIGAVLMLLPGGSGRSIGGGGWGGFGGGGFGGWGGGGFGGGSSGGGFGGGGGFSGGGGSFGGGGSSGSW